MSEEEKILKTIRYCANDYMKQEDGIQCFEWGDLWVLNEYIDKLQQENKQLKEVIEEVKTEISSLMSKYFYEKDFCIEDIHLDKLLQILDKVKGE